MSVHGSGGGSAGGPGPDGPVPVGQGGSPVHAGASAPPVLPELIQPPPAPPPSGPTAVGVVAIVFGAGGVLGGLWGVVVPFVMGALGKMVPAPSGGPNPLAGFNEWAVPMSLTQGLAALVAGMLLAAGIGLVKRRAWSPRLVVVWSVAKMLSSVGVTVVTVLMQQEQMRGVAASAPSGGPPMGAIMDGVMVATGVLTILWLWALPVFMLIWFSRKRIKADVAAWGAGRAVAAREAAAIR